MMLNPQKAIRHVLIPRKGGGTANFNYGLHRYVPLQTVQMNAFSSSLYRDRVKRSESLGLE